MASARVRLVAGASLAAAPGGGGAGRRHPWRRIVLVARCGHPWPRPAGAVPAGAIRGVADLLRFTDEVRASAGAGVRLHVEVVPGEYHATVPPVSLSRGLRWLFEGRSSS